MTGAPARSLPNESLADTAADPVPGALSRVVGVVGVAFTSFNCMVGIGIFGLPALIAAILGNAAILAYGLCLILIALVGLCFAEAGSRVPDSGGMYSYAEAAFGPVVGGVCGTLMLFANCVGSAAAVARFFLDTLGAVWPAFAHPAAGIAFLALLYTVLTTVNVLGARSGSRLTVAIGLIKFLPLLLLVGVGVFAIQPTNITWPGMPSAGKVGEAALILVFAFIGIETGLNIAGEARNPTRTVPRALALALAMVAVLYIGLQLTSQGILGPSLATSQTPLVDTARAALGPSIAHVFVILTLLSAAGYLTADLFASPRAGFALAQAGQLPRWMGYVHPTRHTPAVSIVIYAILVVLATASGSFRQIAIVATSGTLLLYLTSCLSVLRLRAKGTTRGGKPFVAPGGPIVPLAASAIILWLLSTLSRPELIAIVVFVVVTALLYTLVHWRRRTA